MSGIPESLAPSYEAFHKRCVGEDELKKRMAERSFLCLKLDTVTASLLALVIIHKVVKDINHPATTVDALMEDRSQETD